MYLKGIEIENTEQQETSAMEEKPMVRQMNVKNGLPYVSFFLMHMKLKRKCQPCTRTHMAAVQVWNCISYALILMNAIENPLV